MLGLQADRHWPDVLRAVDRAEWADDPRFNSIEARVAALRRAGRRAVERGSPRSRSRSGRRSSIARTCGGRPVQYAHETVDDPQAAAAGGFVDVPAADGGDPVRMVATPVDFTGTPWSASVDATGVRATHRGGLARARLRLGSDHRAEGRRRHPVGNGSSSCSTHAARRATRTRGVHAGGERGARACAPRRSRVPRSTSAGVSRAVTAAASALSGTQIRLLRRVRPAIPKSGSKVWRWRSTRPGRWPSCWA